MPKRLLNALQYFTAKAKFRTKFLLWLLLISVISFGTHVFNLGILNSAKNSFATWMFYNSVDVVINDIYYDYDTRLNPETGEEMVVLGEKPGDKAIIDLGWSKAKSVYYSTQTKGYDEWTALIRKYSTTIDEAGPGLKQLAQNKVDVVTQKELDEFRALLKNYNEKSKSHMFYTQYFKIFPKSNNVRMLNDNMPNIEQYKSNIMFVSPDTVAAMQNANSLIYVDMIIYCLLASMASITFSVFSNKKYKDKIAQVAEIDKSIESVEASLTYQEDRSIEAEFKLLVVRRRYLDKSIEVATNKIKELQANIRELRDGNTNPFTAQIKLLENKLERITSKFKLYYDHSSIVGAFDNLQIAQKLFDEAKDSTDTARKDRLRKELTRAKENLRDKTSELSKDELTLLEKSYNDFKKYKESGEVDKLDAEIASLKVKETEAFNLSRSQIGESEDEIKTLNTQISQWREEITPLDKEIEDFKSDNVTLIISQEDVDNSITLESAQSIADDLTDAFVSSEDKIESLKAKKVSILSDTIVFHTSKVKESIDQEPTIETEAKAS